MPGASTAAQSLSVAAAIFPSAEGAIGGNPPVNDSSHFHLVLSNTVQTLSTNNSPDQGPVKGLLFVPNLPPDDGCNQVVAPFVPQNVTRLRDISQFSYQAVGLAPWVSPDCTQAFLSASRKANIQALVVFRPSDSDKSKPPPSVDPSWSLGGADGWKNLNQYPVYAIPGLAGATLMHQLSFYSGSSPSSTVKISATQSGAVRLVAMIDLTSDSQGPNIWGFILAILGSILVLSIILVVLYQYVQRRRRTDFRQRIETGQVDLEHSGLNHIKVPREVLEQMPIYSYPDLSVLSEPLSEGANSPTLSSEILPLPADNPPEHNGHSDSPSESEDKPQPEAIKHPNDTSSSPQPSPVEEKQPTPEPEPIPSSSSPATASTSNDPPPTSPLPSLSPPSQVHQAINRLSRTQTTCAICLDDFIPHSSTVRELPCGHIFHSACIDTFLTQNSCLCPLCKKSVLPPGRYRAPVPGFMLRRGGRVEW